LVVSGCMDGTLHAWSFMGSAAREEAGGGGGGGGGGGA
jgi:hypothetical protein